MKKIFVLILTAIIAANTYAQIVYSENFNSYVDATGVTVSGNSGDYPDNVSLWTIDTSNASFGSSGYIKTVNNAMQSSDVDGYVLWKTKFVQTYNQPISFFINFSAAGGMENTDYINVYYRLNDADSVLVANWNGYGDDSHTLKDDTWSPLQFYVTNLTASDSVQIIIEFKDNAAAEKYNMDNVIIIAGGISNISSGNDAEKDSIYAQNDTQTDAEIVLDFSVDDDNILDGDSKPTQISSLVITNTSWNDFSALSDIFAGALLTDGTNEQTANITFSNDTIYISSIANSTSSDLGYIDDNASKNYTLKLWFNSDLGAYKTQIDTMQAGFRISANILDSNITTSSSGSSFCPLGDTVNSGATKDNIAVVASTTYFKVEPSDVQVGAIIYPYVQIEATDDNFNRDLDYNDTLTVTNNGCGSIEGDTAIAQSGVAIFKALRHKAVEAGITLTSEDKQGNFTANTSSQYSVTYTVYDNYTLAYWSFDNDSPATTYAWHTNTDSVTGGYGVGYYLPGATTCPDAAYYAGDNSVSYFDSDNGRAMWTQEWTDGDEYWQIAFSSKGFRNLTLSSLQRSYDGAPTSFTLQYKIGANGTWTDLTTVSVANDWTTGAVTNLALPDTCSNQDSVFIRWLNADAASTECDTSAIDEIKIQGQILPLSQGKYYKTAGNTTFSQSCNWLVADDKDFTVNTGIPMVPPDYYSDTIIIVAGDSAVIDLTDTIDQTIVEENAFLNLKNYDLYINDSTGTDFVVNGTFKDDAQSGNGINFLSTGATWLLGANGTIIKTDNSSSTRYRDYYEGGMANIPASAKWILRYEEDGAIPTFTTIGSYYPNLYFESGFGHHSFENVGEYFSGSSSTATIKGNLYIGGNGSGTVKVFNLNTNENPVKILGDIYVKPGDTLLTNNGTYSGTGFEIEGSLIDSGVIKISSDTNGILLLSGSNNQTIQGNGLLTVWDATIDKTAGEVLVSMDSLVYIQDTLKIQSTDLFALDTITRMTVDSAIINNAGGDKFLLKSGVNISASLLHYNNNVAATVEKYMTQGWHLFFPPLSAVLKDSLTYVTDPWTNPNLYTYDETIEDYWLGDTTYSSEDGWVKYTDDNLDTTKGYLFSAHADYTFTLPGGNLITQTKKFNLSYTDHGPGQPPAPCDTVDWIHYDGWNLVGNPYATAIDWNKVTFNNTDNVVYYYNNQTGEYAYYSLGDDVYDFGITVNGGSRYVPVGQGFFVKANASGAYIIIPDTARVHNTTVSYRKNSKKSQRPMINMYLTSEEGKDQCVVAFSDKATMNHDKFDAFKKYFGQDGKAKISTIINGYEHAIDFIPPADSICIPLHIKYDSDGKLILTIENTTGNYLYIHDKNKNTYIQGSTYTFDYNSQTDSNRLELISIVNTAPAAKSSEVEFVYPAGEQFAINLNDLFENHDWGDTLTFDADWGAFKPEWINKEGNLLTGKSEQTDNVTFDVKATDKMGLEATTTINITIAEKAATQDENGITLYPNPAGETINIRNAQNMLLTVYSSSGKVVDRIKIDSQNYLLKLQNLKPGIYIFDLQNNNQKMRYKVIKK